MKIENLIIRSGESGLNELFSSSLLEILYEFENQPTIKRLAEVAVEIHGEITFITDSSKRRFLFQYLKEDEAITLCNEMGLCHKSPWDSLNKFNLTPARKDTLINHFGIKSYFQISYESKTEEYIEVIEPKYPLFPHQEKAANSIKSKLVQDRSRVLLHMPTGSGKTRTAMSICVDFLRNNTASRDTSVVVWLADTYELCEQAYSEFKKAWLHLGVGSARIHKLYGNSDITFSDIKSGFVVCGLQKLNSSRQVDVESFYSLGSRTDLVVFDEAHKAIAPSYQHIIDLFQSAGRASLLGLSATPGRATYDAEKNKIFAEFFNHNKVTLSIEGYTSPVQYLEEKGYLSKVTYHEIPHHPKDLKFSEKELSALEQGQDISDSSLKALGMEAKRNIKILTLALDLLSKDKKIILFACSVESAEAIFSLLRYNNVKAGLVTSDTPESIRRNTIDRYKKLKNDDDEINILVNFGVLTTGFDAPSTNVAIIARPTNSLTLFSQMVGRATRGVAAGGNEFSDVFYIKDTLPGMIDMVKAFSYWDDAWA
ncbi:MULTISPECIES: DEAD/DEAH box helicase [Vibrio]|uniref:DEAD/DEAH box helicase n=1 Tax=Vibrio TaxID=662 RepID=UPI000DE2790D|nr:MULTISPECIES: DEAD/DEAH box helicase [Vibrio]ELJ8547614.1 DEAD/DEAH box helicase [Vibrio cholerae]ELY5187531.1 DEAD/DEAH box helicase [Vibrio cholerae]ELY5287877.1 DEAD/DEAH box helicase [Vibrio cholerae]RBM74713.1 ATP-dependent helicase [Vibrio paracholerae]TQP68911.1 DEAD/DEAH box helicase [Vibrio cholerae]